MSPLVRPISNVISHSHLVLKVTLLAVLSLLPAQDMVRTGVPGQLEHFLAYAGSSSIVVAGYGRRASPAEGLMFRRSSDLRRR